MENNSKKELNYSADIFSFGCIIYEIFSGKKAYIRSTRGKINESIFNGELPDFDLINNENIIPIIKKCLQFKREERVKIEDLVKELEEL